MQVVDGLGIAMIFVMAVALGELKAARKSKRFEAVFVDGFAPERISFSVCIVLIISAFVAFRFARRFDECAHEIGRQ